MFKHRRKIATHDRAHEAGFYVCSCCANPLFEASKMFEVGSSFPSFWAHIGDHITPNVLDSYGRERTQLLCSRCGQHLGHLFDDARTPTHVRYCINQAAIRFAK